MFFYSPDRKGEHPQKHLKTFTGLLHADGYAGFNAVFKVGKATVAAHITETILVDGTAALAFGSQKLHCSASHSLLGISSPN